MPHWLTHWFQFNYAPTGQPFYNGADWPNVFVILLVAPLGWLWSRTKFWPLRPMRQALHSLHAKMDEHREATRRLHEHVTELHARHDQHAEDIGRLGRSLAELHEKLDGKKRKKA